VALGVARSESFHCGKILSKRMIEDGIFSKKAVKDNITLYKSLTCAILQERGK
jgi:hypothetical protein